MKKCLHCREQLGIIRSLRSSFCSDQHEKADKDRMQRLMVERLQQSASRFRATLNAADTTNQDLSAIYHGRYLELMAKLANSPNWKQSNSVADEHALANRS